MAKEKNILSVLADNPALIEAVKATLVKQFEMSTPVIKDNTSDLELGQFMRAKLAGLKAVDEAFKEILQYKTIRTNPTPVNPAR